MLRYEGEKNMWDFDDDSFITLTDENGNEVDFLLLDVMEREDLTEFQYVIRDGNWFVELR